MAELAGAKVLIRGVGSHNGGAELLLKAAADRVLDWGATPVTPWHASSREIREAWGIGRYHSVGRLGRFESTGLDFVPGSLAQRVGVVSARHVDAVLDASGFSYGDSWSPAEIERTANAYERWASRGVPIVMLPQAMGPFERPEIAAPASRLLRTARLVGARDAESAAHIRKLIGDAVPIVECPDITIALSGGPPSPGRHAVAIVPNSNLYARQPDATAESYALSLIDLRRRLVADGFEVDVLLHSQHGDPIVVEALKRLEPGITVVTPSNGLEAKKAIATYSAVVAGRYHAVVSALSQGVPAVIHSWSHKYKYLADDFGIGGVLSDPFDSTRAAVVVSQLTADASTRDVLALRAGQISKVIEAFWDQVERRLLPQ